MSKNNEALTTRATGPASEGAVLNLLDAETKLINLSQNFDVAFAKAVFERAEQVAKADPANLDVGVSLLTTWEQQNENYKKSKSALSSFQKALAKVQKDEMLRHPKEALAAVTAKRDALKADLNEREAGDDVLKKEITRLDGFILKLQPPGKQNGKQGGVGKAQAGGQQTKGGGKGQAGGQQTKGGGKGQAGGQQAKGGGKGQPGAPAGKKAKP